VVEHEWLVAATWHFVVRTSWKTSELLLMECFDIGSGGAVCEACSGVGVHYRSGVDGIEIKQKQLMQVRIRLQF